MFDYSKTDFEGNVEGTPEYLATSKYVKKLNMWLYKWQPLKKRSKNERSKS